MSYRFHLVIGDWYAADCSMTKYALCEGTRTTNPSLPTLPSTARTTTPSMVGQGCPAGWKTQDDLWSDVVLPNCYKVTINDFLNDNMSSRNHGSIICTHKTLCQAEISNLFYKNLRKTMKNPFSYDNNMNIHQTSTLSIK